MQSSQPSAHAPARARLECVYHQALAFDPWTGVIAASMPHTHPPIASIFSASDATSVVMGSIPVWASGAAGAYGASGAAGAAAAAAAGGVGAASSEAIREERSAISEEQSDELRSAEADSLLEDESPSGLGGACRRHCIIRLQHLLSSHTLVDVYPRLGNFDSLTDVAFSHSERYTWRLLVGSNFGEIRVYDLERGQEGAAGSEDKGGTRGGMAGQGGGGSGGVKGGGRGVKRRGGRGAQRRGGSIREPSISLTISEWERFLEFSLNERIFCVTVCARACCTLLSFKCNVHTYCSMHSYCSCMMFVSTVFCTSPTLTSPTLTSPTLTSPTLTSPALNSPTLTSPTLTSPALTSPQTVNSGGLLEVFARLWDVDASAVAAKLSQVRPAPPGAPSSPRCALPQPGAPSPNQVRPPPTRCALLPQDSFLTLHALIALLSSPTSPPLLQARPPFTDILHLDSQQPYVTPYSATAVVLRADGAIALWTGIQWPDPAVTSHHVTPDTLSSGAVSSGAVTTQVPTAASHTPQQSHQSLVLPPPPSPGKATTGFSSPIAFIPTAPTTAAAADGVSTPMSLSASADAVNLAAAAAVAADGPADVDAASNATWRGDVAGVQAEAEELLVRNTELRRALGKLRQAVMLEARTRMAQLKSILKVSILKGKILRRLFSRLGKLQQMMMLEARTRMAQLKSILKEIKVVQDQRALTYYVDDRHLPSPLLSDQRALTLYVDDRHLASPPAELREIAALTARRRPDVDAKEEELVVRAQVRVLSLREEIERAVHADLRLSFSRCAAALQHTQEAQQAHTQAMQAYMAAHATLSLRLTALSVLKQPGIAEKLQRLREQPNLLSSPAAKNAFLSSLDAPAEASLWADLLFSASHFPSILLSTDHHPSRVSSMQSLVNAQNDTVLALKLRAEQASAAVKEAKAKLPELCHVSTSWVRPEGADVSPCALANRISEEARGGTNGTSKDSRETEGGAGMEKSNERKGEASKVEAAAVAAGDGGGKDSEHMRDSDPLSEPLAPSALWRQPLWDLSFPTHPSAFPTFPHSYAFNSPPASSPFSSSASSRFSSLLSSAAQSLATDGASVAGQSASATDAATGDAHAQSSASSPPESATSSPATSAAAVNISFLIYTSPPTTAALDLVNKLYECTHGRLRAGSIGGRLGGLTSEALVLLDGPSIPLHQASAMVRRGKTAGGGGSGSGDSNSSSSSGGGGGSDSSSSSSSEGIPGTVPGFEKYYNPADWIRATRRTSPGSFLTHILAPTRMGAARAYNLLSLLARGSVLILLAGGDLPPDSCDWAANLVAPFSAWPRLGIAGHAMGKMGLRNVPGSLQLGEVRNAGDQFWNRLRDPVTGVRMSFVLGTVTGPMAARRDVFVKVGGFSAVDGGIDALSDWDLCQHVWLSGHQPKFPARIGGLSWNDDGDDSDSDSPESESGSMGSGVGLLGASGEIPRSESSAWKASRGGGSVGGGGDRSGSLFGGAGDIAGIGFSGGLSGVISGGISGASGGGGGGGERKVKFDTPDAPPPSITPAATVPPPSKPRHSRALSSEAPDLLAPKPNARRARTTASAIFTRPNQPSASGSDSIPQDPFRRQRHDSIGGGIPGAGGTRHMLTPGSAAAAAARQRRMSVQFASGFSKPTGLQLPGSVGGQGGPMTPTAAAEAQEAQVTVDQSLPPKRKKRKSRWTKAWEDVQDFFQPISMLWQPWGILNPPPPLSLPHPCHLTLPIPPHPAAEAQEAQVTVDQSLPPKRKKRKSRWTKAWEDVQDFFQPVSMLWQPWGILNPHSKFMARWNKVFMVASILGFIIDPWFLFTLQALNQVAPQPAMLCLTLDWTAAIAFTVLRSFVDLCYVLQIVVQFRMAYIVPPPTNRKNRFFRRWWADRSLQSPGDLEFDARVIASRYLRSWFLIDVLAALPIPQFCLTLQPHPHPQIVMLVIVPMMGRSVPSNTGVAMTVLCLAALFAQNVPRAIRFFPILSGNAPHVTGLVFETAWANFLLNFVFYLMASNIVGSMWYFLAASVSGLSRLPR
ncbi:unnamed protein product [Closterium sp. Naga37s-1]|nr:unnamed protein product [Closterium sp. Naga37s-1]